MRIGYRRTPSGPIQRAEYPLADTAKRFDQASSDFRFAAAVASFAMLLRQGPYADKAALRAVEEAARAAASDDPLDRDPLVALVRRAAAIR